MTITRRSFIKNLLALSVAAIVPSWILKSEQSQTDISWENGKGIITLDNGKFKGNLKLGDVVTFQGIYVKGNPGLLRQFVVTSESPVTFY